MGWNLLYINDTQVYPFDAALKAHGISHKLISPRTLRHNGKANAVTAAARNRLGELSHGGAGKRSAEEAFGVAQRQVHEGAGTLLAAGGATDGRPYNHSLSARYAVERGRKPSEQRSNLFLPCLVLRVVHLFTTQNDANEKFLSSLAQQETISSQFFKHINLNMGALGTSRWIELCVRQAVRAQIAKMNNWNKNKKYSV